MANFVLSLHLSNIRLDVVYLYVFLFAFLFVILWLDIDNNACVL